MLYYISHLRTNRLTHNLNDGTIRHPTLIHTDESCRHFIFSVMGHGMLISLFYLQCSQQQNLKPDILFASDMNTDN